MTERKKQISNEPIETSVNNSPLNKLKFMETVLDFHLVFHLTRLSVFNSILSNTRIEIYVQH